jgi:hypothetical protein
MHDCYTDFQSSDSLPVASVSDSDFLNAMWCLHPSKSGGFDGIPAFIINSFSDILIPVFKFIFNLSSLRQIIPILYKQAAVVPVFKEGKAALKNNYGFIFSLNTFSEIFGIVIHEHISHHLKSKSKPHQHAFIKSKSAFTNLVAYLDLIIPLVHSQHHVDASPLPPQFSSALDLVPHTLLLHKLDDFGLSCAYITWFHSYLTYRLSHVGLLWHTLETV